MFRLWARAFKNNNMLKDTVIIDDRNETRTHKVFDAVDKICLEFDLSSPIWLDKNVEEFKKNSKVRFRQDNFIDEVDFDYLELQIIEEDDFYF